jgi:hypothetical protein
MDYSKLAPSLAMAYDEYAEGRQALADHVQEDQMPGFVAPRDFAKPARVVVTLECSPDADFSDLEGTTGIEVNAGGGEGAHGHRPAQRPADPDPVSGS